MSILIKGMEMPKSCCQCPVNMEVCKRGYEYLLAHPELYDKRADDCPLVPVPEHGRLIDADANLSVMRQVLDNPYTDHGKIDTAMLKACIKMFEEAPTIIEAEEGELQKLERSISGFYERNEAEEGE